VAPCGAHCPGPLLVVAGSQLLNRRALRRSSGLSDGRLRLADTKGSKPLRLSRQKAAELSVARSSFRNAYAPHIPKGHLRLYEALSLVVQSHIRFSAWCGHTGDHEGSPWPTYGPLLSGSTALAARRSIEIGRLSGGHSPGSSTFPRERVFKSFP